MLAEMYVNASPCGLCSLGQANITSSYTSWGRDRVGWNLSKQAGSNVEELADQHSEDEPQQSDKSKAAMQENIDRTYWGIFSLTS